MKQIYIFCLLKSYLCIMKIILSILSILLLACTSQNTEIPTDILSEKSFVNILKEVHLAEAAFELNKSKNMENAKGTLANSYQKIYKKHTINDAYFSKSLNYYASHPERLEDIYKTVLEKLREERTTLNQQ